MENGDGIVAGEAYLWRVAARHPTFGEGPFSEPVRVYFEKDDEPPEGLKPGEEPRWRISSLEEHHFIMT